MRMKCAGLLTKEMESRPFDDGKSAKRTKKNSSFLSPFSLLCEE